MRHTDGFGTSEQEESVPETWLRLPHAHSRVLPGRDSGLIKVTFEETRITGKGGADAPHLEIPLIPQIQPVENLDVVVTSLAAELFIGWVEPVNSIPFARVWRILPPDGFARSEYPLALPLCHRMLERIEEQRKGGDVRFTLGLEGALVVRSISDAMVKDADYVKATVQFRVPRSEWVDSILPRMGYRTRYIVEIAVPEPADLAPSFRQAVEEFKKAESAFRHDNYDDVLIECRNAINAIASAFTLDLSGASAEYKTRVDAFRKQYIEPRVGETKAGLVADELRALWRPLSAATKPGPFTGDRLFAKHVLHTTASLLAYLGNAFSE